MKVEENKERSMPRKKMRRRGKVDYTQMKRQKNREGERGGVAGREKKKKKEERIVMKEEEKTKHK